VIESDAVPTLRRQPFTTAGLLIGIASAFLACFAAGRDMVSGPAADVEAGTAVVDLPTGVIVVFLIGAVLLGGALAIPATWARIVGTALLTALASTYALIVVIARTSDDFREEADLSLEGGGIVLAGAFGVCLVGLVLALIGSRELVRPVDPERLRPGTSGSATASLVLGIAGLFATIAASLAIVFSVLAVGEINGSGSVRTGRGIAIAGLVLGIVWLTLWALFLIAGIFVATPTGDA
jgi:hypothetical protein